MDYRKEISIILSQAAGIAAEDIEKAVETPGDSGLGDYAYPCFRLSKTMKKAPGIIAGELIDRISLTDAFERVSADGAYLNFFVNKVMFSEKVISEILDKGLNYGSDKTGEGKTIVIDYSSPNVTHEFHIGHLFSTVIGAALYRIYGHLGYTTVGINYVGDWGSQFGKLLYAYNEWSGKEALEKGGLDELTRVYVKFHDESEHNSELKQYAREWLVKLENGDREAVELWKWFREICINSMEKTYKRLGITFDSYRGESYYNDKMGAVVAEIAEKGLLEESEGAKIVVLEKFDMPACLILRRDGGTLYPTRDIAAAFDRKATYDFHKSIYVTDMRQSLHFAQFFKVIELMGYEWAGDLIHIPFGLLSLETGPLASRKGNVILLQDLFDEAVKYSLKIINEKNSLLSDKESVAEDVGVGAVVFGVLYTSRIKDLVFSWDKALNFDGETGPYVQYTHARACSVLEKGGAKTLPEKPAAIDYSALTDPSAQEVIRALSQFPDKIKEAADKNEPFVISRSLVQISQAFNKFYHDNPILTSADNIKTARLVLVRCVRNVLKTGLGLLGIKSPEQM